MKIYQNMLVTCLLLVFVCLASCGCKKQSYVLEQSSDKEEEIKEQEETESDEIYVQISGAIVHPGVYGLSANSRIFQLIEKSGGLTKEADVTDLNQAQRLEDGQKIVILTKEEAEHVKEEQKAEKDSRININSADKEELMTLKGIGETKADAIIKYRQKNGNFSDISQLLQVPGIKEGTYSKIQEEIKTD